MFSTSLTVNSVARGVEEFKLATVTSTDDDTPMPSSNSPFCMTIGSGEDADSKLLGAILAHVNAKETNPFLSDVPVSVKECVADWAADILDKAEYYQ